MKACHYTLGGCRCSSPLGATLALAGGASRSHRCGILLVHELRECDKRGGTQGVTTTATDRCKGARSSASNGDGWARTVTVSSPSTDTDTWGMLSAYRLMEARASLVVSASSPRFDLRWTHGQTGGDRVRCQPPWDDHVSAHIKPRGAAWQGTRDGSFHTLPPRCVYAPGHLEAATLIVNGLHVVAQAGSTDGHARQTVQTQLQVRVVTLHDLHRARNRCG